MSSWIIFVRTQQNSFWELGFRKKNEFWHPYFEINDKVPKVGFHKSVALSIITIFDLTSWIFLSLENFAYSKNVKKCPGAKRQKAPRPPPAFADFGGARELDSTRFGLDRISWF